MNPHHRVRSGRSNDRSQGMHATAFTIQMEPALQTTVSSLAGWFGTIDSQKLTRTCHMSLPSLRERRIQVGTSGVTLRSSANADGLISHCYCTQPQNRPMISHKLSRQHRDGSHFSCNQLQILRQNYDHVSMNLDKAIFALLWQCCAIAFATCAGSTRGRS